MPVMECSADGKPGYKYGEAGRCYTYTANNEQSRTAAKAKAVKQGRAIEISRHIAKIAKKKWSKEKAVGWLKEHNLPGSNYEKQANYHSFRQEDPDQYTSWAFDSTPFGHDEEDGIVVVYGIKEGKAEIQAIRFYHGEGAVGKTSEFDIVKTDDDNNLAFGWAYIAISKEGKQEYDHSGEFIDDINELEMAAYAFNIAFRESGEMHKGEAKGVLVDSVVFTKEKLKMLHLPEDALPQGWWVGFYFPDDEVFEKVRSGVYKMFSIHGKAHKEVVGDE